jgi:HTH-type transcriptional regulator/antitoxin HipB
MLVRTPADLGAVIRDKRKQLELNQATLAERIGASRQWIIELERGHPRAELGLVLRALDALDIHLDTKLDQTTRPSSSADIDAVLAKARKGSP